VNVVIRRATLADLDVLVALNEVVQKLHAELEPGNFKSVIDKEEVKAFFADRVSNADCEISLAEVGDRPVGYIRFDKQERDETPFRPAQRCLYVHHIAVERDARRAGVASALMRSAQRRARAEGMKKIALDVWAANADARKFFDAEGFSAFNLVLRKDLA
jgi:ribosomal protein S18 acetylase RimI-like enzyme